MHDISRNYTCNAKTILSIKGEAMDGSGSLKKVFAYQAPILYVVLFYGVLTAWTILNVTLMVLKITVLSNPLLLMIGFFIVYTWYFSLGICYEAELEDEGRFQLKSLRRTLRVDLNEIKTVEGPPFSIGLGFIRFRLAHEKVYLFSILGNKPFQRILLDIQAANPKIKFVKFFGL